MPISDNYGEHVVAFVDILGFSLLVERMNQCPSLIDDIYEILSGVQKREVSESFGDWLREGSATLTVASDSIFFSIDTDAWSGRGRSLAWACLATVESIFWLQRYLLRRGILTRGGIALGQLLHHHNVIFGPALVRAYRLESQLALFPRVIVDAPVLNTVLNHVATDIKDSIFPLRLASLTRRDMDGLTHIDYLHFDEMGVENEPRMAALFRDLRQNIEAALIGARSDVRVFQKVAWLTHYFNDSLARLVSEDVRGVGQVEPIEVGSP